jgi:PAS domain-containing protein
LKVVDLEGRRLTQEIIREITERMRAEAMLRESEERYRVIAESASDVILVIDEDSRIEFANPARENLLGYLRDELIGQPLTVLIPEDLRFDLPDAQPCRCVSTRRGPYTSLGSVPSGGAG